MPERTQILKKQYTISDFSLDEKTLMLHETLFHNANGYLGVRGCLEENVPHGYDTMRGMYVNGFYDVIPMKQSESLCNLIEEKDTMLNIADVQSVILSFDGEEFSMFNGEVLTSCRTLDMDEGTTERTVLWRSPSGREAEVRFIRMASFAVKNVFTIECRITPKNFSGKADVFSAHAGLVHNYSNPNDPRMGSDTGMLLKKEAYESSDGASFLTSRTVRSGLEVCTGVKYELPGGAEQEITYCEEEHCCRMRATVALKQGETVSFAKYCVTVDSLRSKACMDDAKRIMGSVFGKADALHAAQRDYLASFWKSAGMEIDSDDDSSIATLFNQYELLQSTGDDGIGSVASKGLSGEGYEGHYFWDTEIYVLPFLTYTSPELARKLLGYRYATLPLARENAKLLGHKSGALYPWRTISGRECSGYFPSGTAQYHINGDIACAVIRYYLTTGDREYMAAEGAEILIETARLWCDVGNFHDGYFVINDVTGPDEYTCIVNNNYYTNASARYNLIWALKMPNILGESWNELADRLNVTADELEMFAKAAEQMLLPYDEKLGINPQDDSFLSKPVWDFEGTPKENYPLLLHYHPLHLYRYQVCKQADTILAYLLFDCDESYETRLRSFEYYEKITTHDSSLSKCIFSIVASKLGLYDKAWAYFGDCLKGDINNSHGNTGDGIHTANMGGSYMVIVNGFAGMDITENGLSFAPFLPKAWRGYRFNISCRGSLVEVDVREEKTTLKLLSGDPVTVKLYGEEIALDADAPLFSAKTARK